MTQEDFDRAVAAAVYALSRQQPGAPAPPSLISTRPRPITTTPPWNPLLIKLPSEIPARGKGPETGEGSGVNSSPFTRRILDEELPRHFRTPQFPDYTGSTDPEDHVGRFENAASLHQYTDAIKCRVFSTTLSGSALRWFSRLPPASIGSFADFKDSFLRHFATSRTYRKTTTDLFSTKQRSRESLKDFVHRFNQVAQEVPDATSEVLVSAFSQGLIEGDFFRSLIKKPPANFDILLSRVVKYIHVEEAQSSRRKKTDPNHQNGPSRNPPAATRTERRPPPQLQRRSEADHPYGPRQVQSSYHSRRGQSSRTRLKRATPPVSATSTPESCVELLNNGRKDLLRQRRGDRPLGGTIGKRDLLPREPLAPETALPRRSAPPPRRDAPRNVQVPRQEEAPEDNRNNAPRGHINMITGGATDGDSHRARKAHSRQLEVYGVGQSRPMEGPIIGFGPQDLEGIEVPHDDALVIRATIANYDIARIFVDTGSSVNIFFKRAFDQMQIDEADLATHGYITLWLHR
ncbi:uncharacterized protein LOC141843515 [Curcuma longa]|uniref:uncharacterized protein LOC141843515 n=1 Tax=Curcuma longa TaxID=136217 RepID=UPI003D9E2CF5